MVSGRLARQRGGTLRLTLLTRHLRVSITSERDLVRYMASVTAVCVAIALTADVINQLTFFVDWATCLRSWTITVVVVLVLAIPITRAIGRAHLELYRAKLLAEELGRTDDPPLIGQARHAFNIEPSYELGRYSVHTGISYNGANDNAYQYFNNQADPNNNTAGPPNGPLGDNYFFPHLQVDAQAGARLYRGLSLVFDGLNLNNEVFGFYNGSPQYMTQREYYKPTYSASLRWTSLVLTATWSRPRRPTLQADARSPGCRQ